MSATLIKVLSSPFISNPAIFCLLLFCPDHPPSGRVRLPLPPFSRLGFTTCSRLPSTMRVSTVCFLILAVLSPVFALPYALLNSGTPVARDASPVLAARHKPSHSPSPSPRPHGEGHIRESRVPVFKPRAQEQEIVLSPDEASAHLCPESMTVCPITGTAPSTLSGWIQEGYECVDTQEDLTSCGGCSTLDTT